MKYPISNYSHRLNLCAPNCANNFTCTIKNLTGIFVHKSCQFSKIIKKLSPTAHSLVLVQYLGCAHGAQGYFCTLKMSISQKLSPTAYSLVFVQYLGYTQGAQG